MRVLIADDHALVREGIKFTLQKIADSVAVFEAKNGLEVMDFVSNNADIDIVLLDLFMPNTDGFQLLKTLCDIYPDLPVIILSASENSSYMRRAIDWGASGYIPKSASQDVLLGAVQKVIDGGVYIPPVLFLKTDETNSDEQKAAKVTSGIPKLTGRQLEVLQELSDGKSNKKIAQNLNLSEYTVKIHVTAILKLLKVKNRTQAVLEARRIGLFSEDILS